MLIMDESLEAEEAIKKIRELRGPGAIQSVKVGNQEKNELQHDKTNKMTCASNSDLRSVWASAQS